MSILKSNSDIKNQYVSKKNKELKLSVRLKWGKNVCGIKLANFPT